MRIHKLLYNFFFIYCFSCCFDLHSKESVIKASQADYKTTYKLFHDVLFNKSVVIESLPFSESNFLVRRNLKNTFFFYFNHMKKKINSSAFRVEKFFLINSRGILDHFHRNNLGIDFVGDDTTKFFKNFFDPIDALIVHIESDDSLEKKYLRFFESSLPNLSENSLIIIFHNSSLESKTILNECLDFITELIEFSDFDLNNLLVFEKK